VAGMVKKIKQLGILSLVMITVGSVDSIRNLPATEPTVIITKLKMPSCFIFFTMPATPLLITLLNTMLNTIFEALIKKLIINRLLLIANC
jgi:hypothetical protein